MPRTTGRASCWPGSRADRMKRMQETRWLPVLRGAQEGCWLLVFGFVPLAFSHATAITFIHDKIPLFRALVEVGLLLALFGALLGDRRPARRSALSVAVAVYTVVLLLATAL